MLVKASAFDCIRPLVETGVQPPLVAARAPLIDEVDVERRRLVGQFNQLRRPGVGRGGVEEVDEGHRRQNAAAAPGVM